MQLSHTTWIFGVRKHCEIIRVNLIYITSHLYAIEELLILMKFNLFVPYYFCFGLHPQSLLNLKVISSIFVYFCENITYT